MSRHLMILDWRFFARHYEEDRGASNLQSYDQTPFQNCEMQRKNQISGSAAELDNDMDERDSKQGLSFNPYTVIQVYSYLYCE